MLHVPIAPNPQLRLGGQPRCRCGAPTLARYRSVPCCRACKARQTLRAAAQIRREATR